MLSLLPAAEATHNNKGTIKVHDEEDVDPDVRNQPHVSCDFWIEGFKMGDDSGWLVFFDWPPTGTKSEVTPDGDDLNWTADDGDEPGEFHFKKGPYGLPAGHYRVEAYTDDGHPNGGGHFAKAKMFWVDECEGEENPPDCPENVNAQASTDTSGDPTVELTWDAVVDADSYAIYRAVDGGEFEFLADTTDTSYTDTDVEPNTVYEYIVTTVIGQTESEKCESVRVVTVPFFPSLAVGALAVLGSVGAFAYLRRRA